MSKTIRRVTLFKIADATDQESLLEAYKSLQQNAVKNGKPYILSLHAGKAFDDQRAQGWNIVSQTTFASLEDMKFYDTECAGHAALKKVAKHTGVMTVFFESIFD